MLEFEENGLAHFRFVSFSNPVSVARTWLQWASGNRVQLRETFRYMLVETLEPQLDLGHVWAICWPMRLASIPLKPDTALADTADMICVATSG
jgi:hypothetical protein